MTAIKTVDASGRITLGKRFAGCRFLIEERGNGDLVLRLAENVASPDRRDTGTTSRFRIAHVGRIVLPSREERSTR